jgi:hypothetical protein
MFLSQIIIAALAFTWAKGPSLVSNLYKVLLIQNQDHIIKTNYCQLKTMVFRLWVIQSESYTTPESFLTVIIEQIIGSRWNLLQKQRLFIPVLCMSKLPQPQQTAQVLNMRVTAVLALWEQHSVLCCPLDCQTWHLQISFFGATWRRECTEKNFTTQKPWKETSNWRLPQLRTVFCGRKTDNMQCCVQVCLAESSGHFQHWTWSHPVHHEFMHVPR